MENIYHNWKIFLKKVLASMFLLPNKQMDSDQPWSISAGTQAYSCAEQRPLSRSRAGLSALTAQLRSLGNFNSSYECPHTPWTLNEQLRLRARRQQRERGEWYKKRLLRIHSGMKGPKGGGGGWQSIPRNSRDRWKLGNLLGTSVLAFSLPAPNLADPGFQVWFLEVQFT